VLLGTLLVVALLVWSLGMGLYVWQLWPARGATDQGIYGLLGMIAGSWLLAGALMQWPMLAICAAVPSALMWAMIFVKVRARIRLRWRKPIPEMPAMLPKVPPADELYDATAADKFYEALLHDDRPPVGIAAEGEAERAQRLAKMFG
jgi:hypothetical protein